jgi:hypothetical protein
LSRKNTQVFHAQGYVFWLKKRAGRPGKLKSVLNQGFVGICPNQWQITEFRYFYKRSINLAGVGDKSNVPNMYKVALNVYRPWSGSTLKCGSVKDDGFMPSIKKSE